MEEKKRLAEEARLAKIEEEKQKKLAEIAEQKKIAHEKEMEAVRQQLELANKDFDDSDIASYASNLHQGGAAAAIKPVYKTPEVETGKAIAIEVSKLDESAMHIHAANAVKKNPTLVSKMTAPANTTSNGIIKGNKPEVKKVKKDPASF